jgi:hypothetical protein
MNALTEEMKVSTEMINAATQTMFAATRNKRFNENAERLQRKWQSLPLRESRL